MAGPVPATILSWVTVEGRTDVASLVPRVVADILLPAVLRRSDQRASSPRLDAAPGTALPCP